MEILLSPPVAFLIYIPLVLVLVLIGQWLAGPAKSNPAKSAIYSGGEPSPTAPASPGYKPFFLVAFFFAILHLGILVLATGTLTGMMGIYLVGLLIALVALILG